jgi:hypothetical protein
VLYVGKTVINKEKHEHIFDMAGLGFESTVVLPKVHHMWTPILNRIKVQVMRPEEFISNLTSLKIC